MTILDGKENLLRYQRRNYIEVIKIKEQGHKAPHLAAVIVGNDGASRTYVSKSKSL